MKAMVLAAGLGTRLRPLTDDRPKALVEINGRALLEITLSRLKSFGIHDVIVNVHHLADMVVEFLKANDNFAMHVEVSREDVLLDTGGALKKAAWFFDDEEPFVLHNVDVLSTIDLLRMVEEHRRSGAIASLAVKERPSSRSLLFNSQLQLCGRRAGSGDEVVRSSEGLRALGFSGVHVVSQQLLSMLKEEGPFSIIDAYLRLAGEGERIFGFRADEYYWRDVGRPADLITAEREGGWGGQPDRL